jgi:4-hydroxy-tetrahydrodipicolinate synthase
MAAVLTPMDDDGAANPGLLAEHCRRLIEAGCSGIVLLGTTGEANSFTLAERQALLEAVLEAGLAADAFIVGTGCCAIEDSAMLTRHALSLGVSRALMLPPFYYKGVSDAGVFAAYARVFERVNDERLRAYIYRIPQMIGVDFGIDLVEALHAAFPSIVAGIKDSSGKWEDTEALCRRLGSAIDVFVGNETLLMRALEAGAAGCVTATANVNARAIVELFHSRERGDAATLERSVAATRAAFEGFGLIPALKVSVAQTTGVRAWRNVRPPLLALTDAQERDLFKRLGATAKVRLPGAD